MPSPALTPTNKIHIKQALHNAFKAKDDWQPCGVYCWATTSKACFSVESQWIDIMKMCSSKLSSEHESSRQKQKHGRLIVKHCTWPQHQLRLNEQVNTHTHIYNWPRLIHITDNVPTSASNQRHFETTFTKPNAQVLRDTFFFPWNKLHEKRQRAYT